MFLLGGPQHIGPMVSRQGPLRELSPALCLPHCPGTDFSLSPAPRPNLTPEHMHSHTYIHTETRTCTHTNFCVPTHNQSGLTIEGESERERERNMTGGGSVSAYTEECLPQMSKGWVQCNTCPVTQTYVTGLLIVPPKIGHRDAHLHHFAHSSTDQGKVNIKNVQMARFHIWLYKTDVIGSL